MKKDVVAPAKPIFYKQCVDNAYLSRIKSMKDESFDKLNSYQEKIKLAIDINPRKILDSEIIRTKDTLTTQVYNKRKKFPVH